MARGAQERAVPTLQVGRSHAGAGHTRLRGKSGHGDSLAHSRRNALTDSCSHTYAHTHTHTRYRLICLAWAGGNSSIYRDWEFAGVEVCAVELPGRLA